MCRSDVLHNHSAMVTSSRHRDLNRPTANIPSAYRIANIALNDAVILPYDANPGRMEFSEWTTILGAPCRITA